jgi:hypothetical protein
VNLCHARDETPAGLCCLRSLRARGVFESALEDEESCHRAGSPIVECPRILSPICR